MLASLLLLASQAAAVDHAPLVTARTVSAAMLAPERERWAVARLVAVGSPQPRELVLPDRRGVSTVFDVDLDVLDGWNVSRGPLRAFWSTGSRGNRHATITAMIGQRVLVRLAATEDGHFIVVAGSDEAPIVLPGYSVRAGEAYISILLPYDSDRLEPGPPKARRWASLWRAGSCLSASALPDFAGYISYAPLPLTPERTSDARRDASGQVVENGTPGRADVDWLLRLAEKASPDFRLLVSETLSRSRVLGGPQMKRDLVLLSLRRPELFPNGLFRVANPRSLDAGLPLIETPWVPGAEIVDALTKPASLALVRDLFELLERRADFVANRARLLPLLSGDDFFRRVATRRLFDKWQGKAPAGADPVAWHTARARMTQAQLDVAKASGG